MPLQPPSGPLIFFQKGLSKWSEQFHFAPSHIGPCHFTWDNPETQSPQHVPNCLSAGTVLSKYLSHPSTHSISQGMDLFWGVYSILMKPTEREKIKRRNKVGLFEIMLGWNCIIPVGDSGAYHLFAISMHTNIYLQFEDPYIFQYKAHETQMLKNGINLGNSIFYSYITKSCAPFCP